MQHSQPTRILSIEDHPVFREGLTAIIGSQTDMALIAQAADAKTGFSEFRDKRPNITLLDLRLPDSDGLSLLLNMRDLVKNARIVVLTTSENDADILRALKAGAAAYMLKSMPRDEILGTIRAVHMRGKSISPSIAARLDDIAIQARRRMESMRNLFTPDAIVLGGSVMKGAGSLLHEIWNVICGECRFVPLERVELKLASLGDDANLIEAARVWHHRFGS